MVGYGNPYGDATVTIRPTDDTFKTTRCNEWSKIDLVCSNLHRRV
jgi:hypothetical protein